MKKIIAICLVLMLIPALGYAQNARDASGVTLTQTRTNFTNIAVLGLDVTDNPGYIVMAGVNQASEYYLWVDGTGDLCIASAPTVEPVSTFPDGSWGNVPCTKVGGQS